MTGDVCQQSSWTAAEPFAEGVAAVYIDVEQMQVDEGGE